MSDAPLVIKAFLVVKADGSMRVMKKPARLYLDEVAFPITVSIPRAWGRVQHTTIDIALPEPPEVFVTVAEPTLADDSATGGTTPPFTPERDNDG